MQEGRRAALHSKVGERRALPCLAPGHAGRLVPGVPVLKSALRGYDAAQRLSHGPLSQEDRTEPEHDEPRAVQPEERVVRHGLLVVELDAAVHLEVGLVEPAVSGRLENLQNPVHAQIKPGRRPGPEEESAQEESRNRQHEDQNRVPRLLADIHRQAREENEKGQPHRQHRHEVVPHREGTAYLMGLRVRHDVVEERVCDHLPRHQHDKSGRHGEKAPPDVFTRRQRGGMQQHVDLCLTVAQQGQSRRDRDEERVIEERDERHHLGLGELRRDPRLGTTYFAVSGRDLHFPARQSKGAQEKDRRQEDEKRATEGVPERDAERRGDAPHAHPATPAGAEPSERRPFPRGGSPSLRLPRSGRDPERMSTR